MTTLEQGHKRLRTLIRFMAKQPPEAAEHFSMDTWAAHRGSHYFGVVHGQPVSALTPKGLLDCGMTACAGGFACTIPSFQKAGLHLIADPNAGVYVEYEDPDTKEKFNTYEAIGRFFEIKGHDTEVLFGPGNKDQSPQEWAQRASIHADRIFGRQTLLERVRTIFNF